MTGKTRRDRLSDKCSSLERALFGSDGSGAQRAPVKNRTCYMFSGSAVLVFVMVAAAASGVASKAAAVADSQHDSRCPLTDAIRMAYLLLFSFCCCCHHVAKRVLFFPENKAHVFFFVKCVYMFPYRTSPTWFFLSNARMCSPRTKLTCFFFCQTRVCVPAEQSSRGVRGEQFLGKDSSGGELVHRPGELQRLRAVHARLFHGKPADRRGGVEGGGFRSRNRSIRLDCHRRLGEWCEFGFERACYCVACLSG